MGNSFTKNRICSACSGKLTAWGKSAAGTKRYYCLRCKKSIVSYQKSTSQRQIDLKWFKEYVLYGVTYQVLARWSKIPSVTLRSHFNKLLKQTPPYTTLPLITESSQYLLLDGLWFGRLFVLIVYKLAKGKGIIHASIAKKEWGFHISKDLKQIKDRGVIITGIVSDGGTGITKAVLNVFGTIPHQICLAHVHRSIISCLGNHPKETEALELKEFADMVWNLQSPKEVKEWNKNLKLWVKLHWNYLREYHTDETGRWWYAHSRVRKAVRILKTVSKKSFVFLNQDQMPKTTNELEGIFSNLTVKWLMHRGLSKSKWPNFLLWFLYFRSKKR